ncbi:hypothetical protein SPHV1_2260005 [Novosphingobium sp. KN65.2]|nr:hypothetical protein SPHV1_2260005 [Novosphingobium sp. KN65.2]
MTFGLARDAGEGLSTRRESGGAVQRFGGKVFASGVPLLQRNSEQALWVVSRRRPGLNT